MAASTTLNAQQRRERARNAYLTGAANTVKKRAAEIAADEREALVIALAEAAPPFSPEMVAGLRALFAGGATR